MVLFNFEMFAGLQTLLANDNLFSAKLNDCMLTILCVAAPSVGQPGSSSD
jgi:hypothetical protein